MTPVRCPATERGTRANGLGATVDRVGASSFFGRLTLTAGHILGFVKQ